MLKTSTPIGVAYIIGLLYFKADTLILSFLATTKQIGFYGVAYSVVAVFLVFPSTFTRTFLPSMVRATKETIEETVHSALRYYAIGGTFGATAIMICGPTVVRIVAGSHFGASVPPMRILGAGLIFIFLGSGISSVCISRGFGNKIFVVSLVGLVLNVVLNVLAIPKFGINGAATATFVCEIISLAMFVRLVRRDIQVRIRVLRPLAKPFTAGVLTCAVLAPIYLRGDLRIIYGLILMPVTCIVYFVTLAILRGFPPELVAYVRKSIVKK
jgi:O-antigen/teichoic acid export membrane protein